MCVCVCMEILFSHRKEKNLKVPAMAQGVKDPTLTQLWYRSHLWLGFDSWPRNFHMARMKPWGKKKKKKEGNPAICENFDGR